MAKKKAAKKKAPVKQAESRKGATDAVMKVNDLVPADYNPRKLTRKERADITASIERFGLVDPIIVNTYPGRENVVVGGHQRLKIAKDLELDEVPVRLVYLTESRERELNVRLNKNTGEWDWDMLEAQFAVDELVQWGFSEEDFEDKTTWEKSFDDTNDVPDEELIKYPIMILQSEEEYAKWQLLKEAKGVKDDADLFSLILERAKV
jgi:hypothetical protein